MRSNPASWSITFVAAGAATLVLMFALPALAGLGREALIRIYSSETTGLGLFCGFGGLFLARRMDDEVMRAARNAAISIGAPVGFALSFIVALLLPLLQLGERPDIAAEGAAFATGSLAGFTLGVAFTTVVVFLCAGVVWMIWWVAKR